MPDDHRLTERGRSLEEQYFRKRDEELIEKIRQAAAEKEARQQLSVNSGLDDPALLDELQALGFTPETVALLLFVPLVQVAWAEGGVSEAERKLIVELARSRGITDGSPADRQLSDWLAHRPSPDVFARATRLLRAMLSGPDHHHASLTAEELVDYCDRIAAASGGLFGINRISAEERAVLGAIAKGLKQPPA